MNPAVILLVLAALSTIGSGSSLSPASTSSPVLVRAAPAPASVQASVPASFSAPAPPTNPNPIPAPPFPWSGFGLPPLLLQPFPNLGFGGFWNGAPPESRYVWKPWIPGIWIRKIKTFFSSNNTICYICVVF